MTETGSHFYECRNQRKSTVNNDWLVVLFLKWDTVNKLGLLWRFSLALFTEAKIIVLMVALSTRINKSLFANSCRQRTDCCLLRSGCVTPIMSISFSFFPSSDSDFSFFFFFRQWLLVFFVIFRRHNQKEQRRRLTKRLGTECGELFVFPWLSVCSVLNW